MPSKPVPEQYVEMPFPLFGLDLSTEYEQQRDGTTVFGSNVRSFEALSQRGRGGSRPGLLTYVPAQVDGSNLIQHLNYVVTSSDSALLTGFDPLDGADAPLVGFGFGFGPATGFLPTSSGLSAEGGPLPNDPFLLTLIPPGYGLVALTPGLPFVAPGTANPGAPVTGDGGVPDPSTNNLSTRNPGYPSDPRYVRTGGSAIQPNRNVARKKKQSLPLFVQGLAGDAIDSPLSYPVDVQQGHLLVCLAFDFTGGGVPTWGVTDSQGNTWVQAVASDVAESGSVAANVLFYTIASVTGSCAVSVTVSGGSGISNDVILLEYSGTKPSSVLDGTSTNAVNDAGTPATMSTGTIPVHHSSELVLGFFTILIADSALTVISTFSPRVIPLASVTTNMILDGVSSIGAAVTALTNATSSPPTITYTAVGASFRSAAN